MMIARSIAIAFSIAAIPVVAQTPPPPVAPTVVDARTDLNNRMTVPVTIAGHGPYAFVVDTGADRTVVSRELADTLRLEPGASATMHSMTGASEVATVRLRGLSVGGGRRDEIHAPALSEANLGAKGLLGVDSLKGQRVVMDFRRGTFTIADGRTRDDYDPDTIVVTARSKYGQLVLVDADIAGTPITVIVDSGAQNTIGNLALLRMLTKRHKLKTVATELIDVTGARLPVEAASLDRIRIGGFTINSVPVGFADAHPFARFGLLERPAMLLGMDTLRSFRRVSVDFAQRKVRFLLPDESRATSPEQWFAFRSPGTTLPL